MSQDKEPKWEVVDDIPGEKRQKNRASLDKKSRLFSKPVLIGFAVGALAIALIPVLRVIVLQLARAWWLWLGVAIYWYWRRLQKRR